MPLEMTSGRTTLARTETDASDVKNASTNNNMCFILSIKVDTEFEPLKAFETGFEQVRKGGLPPLLFNLESLKD
jgi:hypothetical protein